MAASTTAAGADEEAPPQVQKFDAADFASAAAELPDELAQAVSDDLGLEPEQYLANAAAAKVAADVVHELKAEGVDINTAEIDGQKVTIYVEDDDDVKAAEATGAKVVKGEPETAPGLEERETALADDFKGGHGYIAADSSRSFRCSNGFNGTSGSDLVSFTAGHCAADLAENADVFEFAPDTPFGGGLFGPEDFGDPIGTIGPMHLSNGDDGGLLNITEPAWTAPPTVSTWGADGKGNENDGEVNIYDATLPIVGQPACKSGASSGWECGEILNEFATHTVGTGETIDAFIFNACVISGDSGGAIVSGNYALGVNSFSTGAGVLDDCTTWDAATVYTDDGRTDGDYSGGFALSGNFPGQNGELLFGDGFDLSIFVGTPEISSPEEGAEVSLRPTISGTVAAAEGATVTVTLAGAGSATLTGTVNANGDWSVRPDENLTAGDYTFTAVASHTANGANEATTGSEASGSFSAVKPPVEELTVESPTSGQVVESGDPRPSFSGTGHPGASLALTIGEDSYGEATVGDDGSWQLKPSSDLPIGLRFDATITQTFEEDTQSKTVENLGIKVPVSLTTPEDGAEVAGDVVFEGTTYPGATIGLLLEPQTDNADTASGGLAAGLADAPEADEPKTWEGDLEVDEKGNWSFTPDNPVAVGDYKITVYASTSEDHMDLAGTDSANFSVVEKQDDGGDGDDDNGGDEDLPDTGTSNMPFILLGIGLVVAGGAFVAFRAIRGRSMA